MVDALLSNERCFLEGPEWQQLLVSTTDTDSGPLSDTSPISIELFAHLTRIPGFFRRVSDAVWLGDLTPSDELEALVKDLRQERKAVLAWRQEFDCLIVGNNDARFPSSFSYGTYRGARMSAAEEDKRYELLGTGLVVGLFVSRLLSAVCPAGNERSILEDECLSMSREVVRLECVLDDDGDDSTNRRAGLHLNQKAHIAKATLDTAAIWDAPDEDLVVDVDVKTESGPKQVAYGSARTIAKWKFEAWCNAITRKAFAVAELEKRAAKLAGKG